MMKEKFNAVIIDDEEDGRKIMSLLLERYCPSVNVSAVIGDGVEAFEYLQQHNPDIVFLDIEMPRLSGFDLLKQLGNFTFKVIFVTAYDRYMLHAIKVAAFDYLIKPVDKDELINSVERLQNLETQEQDDNINTVGNKLIVPIGNGYEFLDIEEIIRCESSDNYCFIFMNDGRKLHISKTLKYIEELLPSEQFLRVHSKYLIKISAIKKYVRSDGGFFELIDNSTHPISRNKKDEVLKKLGLR